MAESKTLPERHYFWKSFKWLFGNVCWGLIPLWFVIFVNIVSDGKTGYDEIQHIITRDGAILFVCCAIMGSVMVDYVLTGSIMKIWHAYRLLLIPGFIVLLLLTDYALILAKIINYSCFSLNSWTSKIVIALTILFSIFIKTEINIKEDRRHA